MLHILNTVFSFLACSTHLALVNFIIIVLPHPPPTQNEINAVYTTNKYTLNTLILERSIKKLFCPPLLGGSFNDGLHSEGI